MLPMNKKWKKNLILFLASQTVSLFGTLLVQYAIGWHITLKTQSGIMMTIAIICGPCFWLLYFCAWNYSCFLDISIFHGTNRDCYAGI